MITVLLIILGVLLIALWLSAMALWRQAQQDREAKTIKRDDVIHAINKAARLARRSVYTGVRYTRQARVWGDKKARKAFVTVFPASKSAFDTKDMLTGLEHGPSSYFLASISKPTKKPRAKRTVKPKAAELSEE